MNKMINRLNEDDITRKMIHIQDSYKRNKKFINEEGGSFPHETEPNVNMTNNREPSTNMGDGNVTDILIPINNETFNGIIDNEKEKISQKLPDIEFETNSLMLNPQKNTVSFTGIIKNMNNLRWYFTTDTSTPDGGCYIFVEGLQLNDNTLQTLHILQAHYVAWSKDWSTVQIQQKLKINPEEIKSLQEKYRNLDYFKI